MNLIQKQFYALDTPDMPGEVLVEGRNFRHRQTFKYDFFAATGLYESADAATQVVVKIYRCRRFFGLPMQWLGKLSVSHEARLYRMLDDLPGIPKFHGFVGPTGFAHKFIPGHPLKKAATVNDDFFDKLKILLEEIHRRQVAYVDLNKPENVLLGQDENPYLVDFQISFTAQRLKFLRPVLHQLQTEDWYHFSKHKRRLRPDLLTPEDYARSYKRSIPIRIHRIISMPYFAVRHLIMDLLDLKPAE